ncbi:MAG: hypothetical protein NTZ22_13130 [Hyphomicrobiales bacterium]|nr:hypothetical protein [Hyphomicrobiales bacterium]
MVMSLGMAARSVEILCGLSLIIQTLEFLNLPEALGPQGIWTYAIGRDDLAHASKPVQNLFAFLAREDVWLLHLVLRLMAALVLIIDGASLPLVGFLFAGTLVILIRWRGAFNGGSDFVSRRGHLRPAVAVEPLLVAAGGHAVLMGLYCLGMSGAAGIF